MESAPEIVRLLLEYKADVNLPNNSGRTPLHIAADANNIPIAKLLLAAPVLTSNMSILNEP